MSLSGAELLHDGIPFINADRTLSLDAAVAARQTRKLA